MFNPQLELSTKVPGMHQSWSGLRPPNNSGRVRVSVIFYTFEDFLLLHKVDGVYCLPSVDLSPGGLLLHSPVQAIQECFERIPPQEVLGARAELLSKSLGMQSSIEEVVDVLVSVPAERMTALHEMYFSRRVLCKNPQNFGPCVQTALFALKWLEFVPQASSEDIAA